MKKPKKNLLYYSNSDTSRSLKYWYYKDGIVTIVYLYLFKSPYYMREIEKSHIYLTKENLRIICMKEKSLAYFMEGLEKNI